MPAGQRLQREEPYGGEQIAAPARSKYECRKASEKGIHCIAVMCSWPMRTNRGGANAKIRPQTKAPQTPMCSRRASRYPPRPQSTHDKSAARLVAEQDIAGQPDDWRRKQRAADQVLGVRQRIGVRVVDIRVENMQRLVEKRVRIPRQRPDVHVRVGKVAEDLAARRQRKRQRHQERQHRVSRGRRNDQSLCHSAPILCTGGDGQYNQSVGYRTPLEARIAKKTTKAITDFNLVEDGDRIMVGPLGRQGQLGADPDPRCAPAARADRLFDRRRKRRLRLRGLSAQAGCRGLPRSAAGNFTASTPRSAR